MRLPVALTALTLSLFVTATLAQTKKAKPNTEDVDAEAAQQRTVAISLVTSLADEARSFKDQTRRARVQARAADVLWDTDPKRARELFRRAWEAAETVDTEAAKKRAEEMKRMESEGEPVVIRGGPDLRSEVLRLVARRDRKLGEEFLKALDEAAEKERSEAATAQRRNDPGTRLGASQRLQLARRLVEDGEVERAVQFSTPFLYITFERSGGANQSRQRGPTPAPEIDATLRNNFLKVAYQILMQPLAAPDQDRTTSGQTGKYLMIKRLLPVFEQYAADLAPGLRTQMTALASYVPASMQQGENRAVSVGIQPESSEGDPYQRMQERLDRATKSEDRDAIYADYAVALIESGDPRARDLVDKIENTELRKSVKAYTDF